MVALNSVSIMHAHACSISRTHSWFSSSLTYLLTHAFNQSICTSTCIDVLWKYISLLNSWAYDVHTCRAPLLSIWPPWTVTWTSRVFSWANWLCCCPPKIKKEELVCIWRPEVVNWVWYLCSWVKDQTSMAMIRYQLNFIFAKAFTWIHKINDSR